MPETITKYKWSEMKKDIDLFNASVKQMADDICAKYDHKIGVFIDETGIHLTPIADYVEFDVV